MKAFIEIADKVHKLRAEFHDLLISITEEIPNGTLSDLVDIGFLCKDIAELLDDWRKDCNARKELIVKILALRCITVGNSTVQGKLASVSLDATIEVEVPKSGTPEYDEVMKYFGIPIEAPFQPHWRRVQELVAQRYQEGVPLPPGFGKQYTKTKGTFRRKEHG